MGVNAGAINLQDFTIFTIDTGAITATQALVTVAAESGTTDDLDTITNGFTDLTGAGYTHRPVHVVLMADTGDIITVKHQTDNIYLNSAADYTLTENNTLVLFWDGTNWRDYGGTSGKFAIGSFGSPLDVTATRQYGMELHFSGNDYNVTGLRSRAHLVTTDTTATAQGALLQAANNDGIDAGVLNGALIEAIGKSTGTAATISTMRAALVNTEWSAKDTITDLRTLHVRTHTRDSATEGYISGTGYLVYLENEAVGGNGQQLDAGIYLKATNVSTPNAFDYGIDLTGAASEIATADIKLSGGALIRDVSGVVRFGDGTANYLSIGGTGDCTFVGGAGLPFGSCYGNHIAWAQAAAVQNTWYNISDTDMADGTLHNVTHDGDGKLTVTNAGHYLVGYSISFLNDVANDHVECGIEVSGSGSAENAGRCCLENKFASEEEHMASAAPLDLAANATLEVAIRTTDNDTPDFAVDTLNLYCVQIGGT